MVADRSNNKHESSVLMILEILIKSTSVTKENEIKLIIVKKKKKMVTSDYKSPKVQFIVKDLQKPKKQIKEHKYSYGRF